MSVADKLLQINQAKQDIKVAIENKDVDLLGVAFGSYAEKIDELYKVVELTQAQYDDLSVYGNDTYYLISDTRKLYKGTKLLYGLTTPNFLFYGGGSSPYPVIKADLDDLSTLETSDGYGSGAIQSIAIDDTYVYAGGQTTETVRKYLKSNLSYVGESANYGGIIRVIAVDDKYIYASGDSARRVKKYLKSDLSYVGESPSYSSTVDSIVIG